MKYIYIAFLLSPLLGDAQVTKNWFGAVSIPLDTSFAIGDVSEKQSAIYLTTDFPDYNQTISFFNIGDYVEFSKGKIFYSKNKKIVKSECDSVIFDIVYQSLKTVTSVQADKINQLELKLLFYEKYFGKLEGDMNSDCVQFIYAKNAKQIEPCKNK